MSKKLEHRIDTLKKRCSTLFCQIQSIIDFKAMVLLIAGDPAYLTI